MEKATLRRLDSGDQGTFGVFAFPGFSCFSGELPRRDNQPNISAIPTGKYICRWTYSPRFKRMMYLVEGVPSRAGIRKHPANLMGDDSKGYKRQLNGCIALGEKMGWIDKQKALLLSAPAIRRFEQLMNGQTFELEII